MTAAEYVVSVLSGVVLRAGELEVSESAVGPAVVVHVEAPSEVMRHVVGPGGRNSEALRMLLRSWSDLHSRPAYLRIGRRHEAGAA